jgi:beta-N-acetylhexosaminidase
VRRDLRPFRAGIKAGADMIMVSHVIVRAFDKKNPASISPAVNRYLRKDMEFDGVIITDGLGMNGVRDLAGGDISKAAVLAVRAGNDMLCITSDHERCFSEIKKAVIRGDIPEEQIDDSVRRILLMKIRRGIIK